MKEIKTIIASDLFRYIGCASWRNFFSSLRIPGFKYCFYLRLTNYFHRRNKFLFIICFLRLKHYSFKYGIQIPYSTSIGKGFYIGHFSCIVISPNAVIGNNVNISQGVTIGIANRGKKKGVPIISDEVYIGAGAKIIGNIKIGKNVAIGANAVVVDDVPDNAVVAGIPAKIISMNGAIGYIDNKI